MTQLPWPVALCLAGAISPEVALARLVLDGVAPAAIGPLLPAGSAIAAVYGACGGALGELAAMLGASGATHGGSPGAAEIGAMFDRAVAAAPEASVAAWSLNDPATLARGTAEIIGWLEAGGLIGPDCDVLDLGCGIGRVAAALAPLVRTVVGLDVSEGMIAEARRRHRGVPGLRFAAIAGAPPLPLGAGSLHLILAVDSFPYVMQAGLADGMMAEAVRLLRPGAHLVVLNLSYRAGGGADAADAARWTGQFGLTPVVGGARPFELWDGTAFVWRTR